MKFIKLSKTNKQAIVDNEDFLRVNKYKWYINSRYVVHTLNHCDKVKLHHFIIGRPLPPLQIDHINQNTSDNRKCNLRIVPQYTNAQNKNTKIGVGVKRTVDKKKWFAQIERNKQVIYLGVFCTKKEGIKAVKIYDLCHKGD